MPDWQERITRETNPALRAEHDLRYRLAAPLVTDAAAWCDLGCGNGVAAADALSGRFTGRAVLVDVAESAVQAAASELNASAKTTPLTADLTQQDDLDRVRSALLETPGDRVVTCFEVVEHLQNFVPLITMLSELAQGGEATVLLSVPNDAFFATENPHHVTTWGEGAFDELRGLLPEGTTLAKQVALQGSAVVPMEADQPTTIAVPVEVAAESAVPTHFLAAMGPKATELGVHAQAVQTDLNAQRTWEREREAHLAYSQHLSETWTPWFDEWRAYIHDLERRLGLPLSGVDPEQLPSGEPTG